MLNEDYYDDDTWRLAGRPSQLHIDSDRAKIDDARRIIMNDPNLDMEDQEPVMDILVGSRLRGNTEYECIVTEVSHKGGKSNLYVQPDWDHGGYMNYIILVPSIAIPLGPDVEGVKEGDMVRVKIEPKSEILYHKARAPSFADEGNSSPIIWIFQIRYVAKSVIVDRPEDPDREPFLGSAFKKQRRQRNETTIIGRTSLEKKYV